MNLMKNLKWQVLVVILVLGFLFIVFGQEKCVRIVREIGAMMQFGDGSGGSREKSDEPFYKKRLRSDGIE